MFIKTLIFQHFNLKHYIQIKTDISQYIIKNVLSYLIFNYLIFNLDSLKSDFI